MRRNILALDESIESARKAPEGEKAAENRARLKLLRDLIELENSVLATVKVHLLGRDETGAPNEPPDHYAGHHHSKFFERDFKNFLAHQWTLDDLKLKCEDCDVESEEVLAPDLRRLHN